MLTPDEREVLRSARAALRDLAHGWPVGELHADPREVCAELSGLLGEPFDFDTGETP
jgi:hypothetical protein